MRCPKCERETYQPVRVGNLKFRPKSAPQGALLAATLDGTCYTCRRIEKGIPAHGGTRPAPYRHIMTADEIQTAKHSYQRYAARRRARGIPREGKPVSSLVKPGLFLLEVK